MEKTCDDLKNSLAGSTEHNSVLDKKIQGLNAALDREKEERQKVNCIMLYLVVIFSSNTVLFKFCYSYFAVFVILF